jgi:hypothetical protein
VALEAGFVFGRRSQMSLVILTEERSMVAVMNALLPSLGVDLATVKIIAHDGKSDLEASIPKKLRGWRDPSARFLILRDNDRGNCHDRKRAIFGLVNGTGREHCTVVRIVCQELEAWFLADLNALERAGYLNAGSRPAFTRLDPDSVPYPVHFMEQLRRGYRKGSGAATIAPHLDPNNSRSASFRNTVAAIRKLMFA